MPDDWKVGPVGEIKNIHYFIKLKLSLCWRLYLFILEEIFFILNEYGKNDVNNEKRPELSLVYKKL